MSEVASHAVQLSGNQFQILASPPTQLTIACKEGAEVQTIQGVHLLTLMEDCPKANTLDHFFVWNPHIVSSQQLVPLPLLQDAKEWIKEINATDDNVNLSEIFKELKTSYSGNVPIDKFKHRVVNHRIIKYQSWLTYLQIAMTFLGLIVIVYKTANICVSSGFPLIGKLLPGSMRRKKDRVKQYRIVRQP